MLNQCHFGCMVTISHNPVQDSGIKIFIKNGQKPPEQEMKFLNWQMICARRIVELIPENYKPLSVYTLFMLMDFTNKK